MKKENYFDLEKKMIHKKYHKSRMIVFIAVIILSLSMTVAYSADLSSVLHMFGYIELDVEEGNLEITSVSLSSSTNATNNGYTISVKDGSTVENYILVVDFDIDYYRTFGSSTTSITYDVVITNNTFRTQVLDSVNGTATFTSGDSTLSYTMDGANEGTTVLKYGESVTVTLTFSLDSSERNTHYIVDENFEFEFSASGGNLNLFSYLNTNSVSFATLDEMKAVNVTVINNSDSEVTYSFSSDNSNFELVNNDGGDLSSLMISAQTTDDLTIYVKISDEHLFAKTTDSIKIKLNTTSPLILTYDVGTVSATVPQTGALTIISSQTVYDDTSLDFTSVSTSSGMYKNSTSGEITYFYRGNVTDNYVSFGGYIWRIIRIDKYGTRIILDSVIDETAAWASSNTVDASSATTDQGIVDIVSTVLSYSNSGVKTVLDDWYYNDSNLTSYSDIIVPSLFCEDFSWQKLTSSGSWNTTFYFGSYIRNGPDSSGYTPEFVCDSEFIKEYDVGLISGDEISFAGALFNSDFTNYYLYNSNITDYWWSLSPSYYDTSLNTVGVLIVNGSNGRFHDWQNGSTIANSNAIRPVITLDTDRLSGGSGVVGDEYTFS